MIRNIGLKNNVKLIDSTGGTLSPARHETRNRGGREALVVISQMLIDRAMNSFKAYINAFRGRTGAASAS